MTLPNLAACARLAELEEAFDAFLAAAIAGPVRRSPRWNSAWTDAATLSAFADRAIYHGIAGLLVADAGTMRDWPAAVVSRIREQALAQAMWELRHRLVICALLDALAVAGVSAVLLKGTPLAYQLYPDSAQRVRGDTDVLIAPADLATARGVIAAAGFERVSASDGLLGDLHAQEIWKHVSAEGHEHAVDLHWQVLNSPFLDGTMPRAECTRETVAIPALGPSARAMSRAWMLIHACLHRAVHIANPYFVDGREYLGGGRLIWLHDVRLMAAAASTEDWDELVRIADARHVSGLCRDTLLAARDRLGAVMPADVDHRLAQGRTDPAIVHYLTAASQFGRAWLDLRAARGMVAKARFALAQVLPAPEIVRSKYEDGEQASLARLYVRRLGGILRRNAAQ